MTKHLGQGERAIDQAAVITAGDRNHLPSRFDRELLGLEPGRVDAENDLVAVARKLLSAVHEPVTLGGQEVQGSASLGISLLPRDGEDGDSLLRNAESWETATKNYGRIEVPVLLVWGDQDGRGRRSASMTAR